MALTPPTSQYFLLWGAVPGRSQLRTDLAPQFGSQIFTAFYIFVVAVCLYAGRLYVFNIPVDAG
jgi:hypothetical protein